MRQPRPACRLRPRLARDVLQVLYELFELKNRQTLKLTHVIAQNDFNSMTRSIDGGYHNIIHYCCPDRDDTTIVPTGSAGKFRQSTRSTDHINLPNIWALPNPSSGLSGMRGPRGIYPDQEGQRHLQFPG